MKLWIGVTDNDWFRFLRSQTGVEEVKVASRRKKLTVFFSDIIGFTSMSEKKGPQEIVAMLNAFFTAMANLSKAGLRGFSPARLG